MEIGGCERLSSMNGSIHLPQLVQISFTRLSKNTKFHQSTQPILALQLVSVHRTYQIQNVLKRLWLSHKPNLEVLGLDLVLNQPHLVIIQLRVTLIQLHLHHIFLL